MVAEPTEFRACSKEGTFLKCKSFFDPISRCCAVGGAIMAQLLPLRGSGADVGRLHPGHVEAASRSSMDLP